MSDPQAEAKANFEKSLNEFMDRVKNEASFTDEQKKDLLLQANEVQPLDNQHLQRLIDQYSRNLEDNVKAREEEPAKEKAEHEAQSQPETRAPEPKKDEIPLKRRAGGPGRGLSLAKPKKKSN